MESLSDKLKSLGVRKGASEIKPPEKPKKTGIDIAEVVPGLDFETPFGPVFVIEQDFPFTGLRDGGEEDPMAYVRQWAGISDETHPLERTVFLDTETSGLAGGTGTFVFLVGLGHLTTDSFHLVQLFMREPGQEPAFLAALAHYLAPFRSIVSFNGKSFDIPMVNARCVLNGFSTPFTEMGHIDLLPLARRLWKNRLPSRALKDLEVDILGMERTAEEVPGWMIPEIYYDYLRNGDARPLAGVIYHNAQDILSLAKLLDHISRLLSNPLLVASDQGLDIIAVARLYEEMKLLDRAVQLYEFSLTSGIPLPFFLDTLRRYANLYRKQNQWDEAIRLWQKAVVEYRQVDACIELAKHMEHHSRDYESALRWTEMGQSYLAEIASPLLRKELERDLTKRAMRLKQKIKGSAGSPQD